MSPAETAAPLIERLDVLLAAHPRPICVALDGRSGAGKSTLAQAVQDRFGADVVTVIDGDDFYLGGSGATWDARSAEEKVGTAIEWPQQRAVLESLRASGRASWRGFDWEAPDWDADTPPRRTAPSTCAATAIVLLEGAYSARPELADVLDLRVLLDAPATVRGRRLRARDGDEYHDDWAGRWDEAEQLYFGEIMPGTAFDLVLLSLESDDAS